MASASSQAVLWQAVLDPQPPFAPRKATTRPSRLAGLTGERAAYAFAELAGRQRRNEIVADAAAHQLAIEQHVIDVADDDDPGAGVADIGECFEFGEDAGAGLGGLDDDEVGSWRPGIGGDRRLNATLANGRVERGEAAAGKQLGRRFGRGGILAEDMHAAARRCISARRGSAAPVGFAGQRFHAAHLSACVLIEGLAVPAACGEAFARLCA